MNEFRFYKLHKCSYWRRQYFDVKANSYEEAERIAKSMLNFDVDDNENIADTGGDDIIFDTYERIAVEHNNGKHTTEIRNHADEVIAGDGSSPE